MKIKTFRIGGIHPEENKLTHEVPTRVAELPAQAIFPLSQHIGAPAKPVVKVGDKVRVGTLLAEAGGFVSAPIYSSVSGTIAKIDSAVDATGYRKPAIIVKVEGDEWEDSIDRSDKLETLEAHPELTPEEIVERIKTAGVTGMGGAGFPTFIKLTPPPTAKAECVIINAVECEPYITADYRLMMEHADEILVGLYLLMKATKVEKGYIGIEVNKPKAISLFEEKTRHDDRIEVVPLQQRYPQGGEKQLVDAVIRRQVPAPPAIPVNVGAIVQNVGTAFAVYEAVMKHKPLFERYTTVTGKRLQHPANFLVRMGTPMINLIDACGGMPEGDNKLLAGGPMMGKALTTAEVPVCKGTNSVTILSGSDALRKEPQPCIRCAKCVGACPMGLEPYLLASLSTMKNWERAEREMITSCIECGSCQFTCPAHRPLLDNIRQGKSTVMGIIRSRNIK
ncbi:MAG: electron transport complex subunit RsxC [Prevotella sp.]|nr:electron transport complex subunit RsxC [Prevotella sp.]